MEYLFNAKKLKKLDPDGYTYYERRLKGELGRKYERLYQALRRLANHIPDFCYTDYSGWRRLQNSNDAPPLRIEAEDPAHHRHFTFEQRGIMLRTTITDCDTNIARSSLYRRGKIWRLTCWLYTRTNYLFICPGLKNAAE